VPRTFLFLVLPCQREAEGTQGAGRRHSNTADPDRDILCHITSLLATNTRGRRKVGCFPILLGENE